MNQPAKKLRAFRASDELYEDIKDCARDAGIGVAEYIRRVLRKDTTTKLLRRRGPK